MKTLIVSPLFPPDPAREARYTKDLAQRLSSQHVVTLLIFGSLPEKVEGVKIHTVSKILPNTIRLIAFIWKFFFQVLFNKRVLVINGHSVELPTLLISYAFRRKIYLLLVDQKAIKHTTSNGFYFKVHKLLNHRITSIDVSLDNLEKPELLPFDIDYSSKLKLYESAWEEHLKELARLP